jgi:flavin-dependent dehydrogenase
VLLLEKSRFPRYQIGESLLPLCFHVLERTGVLEKVRAAGFTEKKSVQFISPDGKASQPFYFDTHLGEEVGTTWQVVRSEFDAILLEHARDQGVDVREETLVTRPLVEGGAIVGVEAQSVGGIAETMRAPITLDASGRGGVMMSHARWRIPEPQLNRMAIWTYYTGAKRDPGRNAGATTTASLPGGGWVWFIPLPDDRVSVGIVDHADALFAQTRDPEGAFQGRVGDNPWIADQLKGALRDEELRVTSDFSYRSQHCAMDGAVLTGDAFAFLDPVFSSGVFLALRGGEAAAHAIDDALSKGRTDAGAFAEYGEWLCEGMEAMRALVHAFYDPEFSFGRAIREAPETRDRITDCLVGDIFTDLSDLIETLGRFAAIPTPLSHGRAKTEEAA